jgi:FKBP-type peptidyl-prolyl cis-trans isomerase
MKRLIIVVVAFGYTSCQIFKAPLKEGKTYKTKSGLQYTVYKKGKGQIPQRGDRIKIYFVGYYNTPQNTVFKTDSLVPFVFNVGMGQVIKGWDEAFLIFPEGTHAKLIIPPHLAFADKPVKGIPKDATIYHDVYLDKIIEPPVPYEITNQDTLHLESGLKVIKLNHTNNKKAEAFKTVTVEYSGYIDGKLFDSSVNRGYPFTFQLGVGEVIKGLDEGIRLMRVGEKARFVIPPKLGYGEKGLQPLIPPNKTLIFDVELIDVK